MEWWHQRFDRRKLLLGAGLLGVVVYLYLRRKAQRPVVNKDKHLPASLKNSEALKRASALEQVKYELSLDLSESGFSGVAQVQFFCKYPDLLWLDLSVDEVTCLKVAEKPSKIDWRGNRLYLQDLKLGWNTVKVAYRSTYSSDMRGLHIFNDPEDSREYIYSHCAPFNAHKVFPCFDQPDIKAQCDLTVKVPLNWQVFAFSRVLKVPSPGVFVFKTVKAMPTYLFSLSAGEWTVDRIATEYATLSVVKRHSITYRTDHIAAIVEQGLAYFSTYFNMRYPNDKLDVVFVPELREASAEGVESVMLHEEVLSRSRLGLVLALLHELAHMWFGNLVTMKWWNDLWLKESFADFMAYFAIYQSFSEFPEVWQSFLNRKGWGYSNDQLPTTHPISSLVEDAREVEGCFDGIAFAKGAAVLKQLYFKIGGTSFQKRIQRFMKRHLQANATLADFLDVLDEELANDLETWAEDWLHTAGLNELTPVIHSRETVDSFSIVQTASLKHHPTLRLHKLKLEFFDSEMQSLGTHTVEVQPSATTDLEALRGLKPPACVVLNVDDWDYSKSVLDPSSLNVIMNGGLVKVSDPLTRQLLIRSLWDMVRDLKLSAMEFVEVVRKSLDVEDNMYNVIYILEITQSGLERYVPAEHKAETFHLVFVSLVEKAKTYPELHRFVPNFLDHTDDFLFVFEEFETWPFSQKERWEVLKRYSAKTTEAEALVVQEAGRDKSFSGLVAQLYCQNAYPNPDSKAYWWNFFITRGEELSSFERQTAMKGFVQRNQGNLLKPYSALYFSNLPNVFTQHSHQFASDFAIHLMPNYMEESQLIDGLLAALEQVPEEFPGVKKHFLDQLNILRRRAGGLRLSEFFLKPN